MRRFLLCCLTVMAAFVPAFGQQIGSAWYNPLSYWAYQPSSIPNYASAGLVSDEIDALFRSPKDLAQYTGYSVYTAYGNYGAVIGATNWVNPFVSTAPNYGDELGAYQVAATFPVLGFRAGAMLGHVYSVSGNIAGARTSESDLATIDVDANIIGTLDYTTSDAYSSVAKVSSSSTAGLVGLSLGELGVSLYLYQGGTARVLGGTKTYSWTVGTDATYLAGLPGSDTTTAETQYVGYGVDGAEAAYGGTRTITGKALGQYALGNIPLIASLGFSGGDNGLSLANVKTGYSISQAYASTAGGAATAADVNTFAMTYGTNRAAAWSMSAAFPAWAAEPATRYIDPATSKNTFFDLDLAIGAEPVFALNDTLSFKTRGILDVASDSDADAITQAASSSFSKATASANNDIWEYSYASSTGSNANVTTIGLELGGMAVLKDPTGFISLGAGAFAKPSFGFGSTARAAGSVVITRSYGDSMNVNPVTAAAAQAAADLGAAAALIGETGTYEGTSTDSTATTYAGKDTSSTFGLTINLPTAVMFSFAKGKVAAIFGYTVAHTSTATTSASAASTAVRTVTISDGTSTVFTGSSTTVDDGSTSTASSSYWNGQMGWCLRWSPTAALTIDVEGASIMAALDGIGFNDFKLDDLLGTLGLSATFRF